MSNGCRESGKEPNQIVQKHSRNEEFVRAIAKIAVAQICESEGFHSIQQSALECLADIGVRYVKEVGKLANRCATLAGRSDCNVFDVIQGLEDLGMTQGFSGASDVNRSLARSGMIKEISQFIGMVEEIPFVYSLPEFPVVKERKLSLSFQQHAEVSVADHIPKWLPAFPDSKSFVTPTTFIDKDNVTIKDSARQVVEQKKEEPSSQLQQRLTSDNRLEAVLCSEHEDVLKAKRVPECNPYLAAPLHYGDKDVSQVVPPAKNVEEVALNRVLSMETSSPYIEPMKSGLFESDEGRKDISLEGRPAVRLKLSNRKKPLSMPMALFQPGDDEAEKIGSTFEDNEEDENKRRAEQILMESMENHGDLGQL